MSILSKRIRGAKIVADAGRRLFYAQVRVLLARVVWHFDLERKRVDPTEGDWLDQKAWFAFEPRPLLVKTNPKEN